jgi:hypothetical protein
MPIRRSRIQLVLEVSHGRRWARALGIAGTALTLASSGCTSTVVDGHPATGQPTATKTAVPSGTYDAAVYLCVVPAPSPRCHGATSTVEKLDVARRLSSDRTVQAMLYVSVQQSYDLGRTTVDPRVRNLIKPGDLPDFFLVVLADPARVPSFATVYEAVPGVGAVVRCAGSPNCTVTDLRRVGAVR